MLSLSSRHLSQSYYLYCRSVWACVHGSITHPLRGLVHAHIPYYVDTNRFLCALLSCKLLNIMIEKGTSVKYTLRALPWILQPGSLECLVFVELGLRALLSLLSLIKSLETSLSKMWYISAAFQTTSSNMTIKFNQHFSNAFSTKNKFCN